ncbi:MAG: saccharopine dehydrogenase NADP-binding domain-containing protein [Deltaproteobacteria bacterium]|nr:saccharopine dehydrogenase NADP-binding domain-containing protein [Deltaproteobacteria bacterium]
MKMIVLGGAGDMGSRAVEDLAETPGVESVTIADINMDAAHALAARVKDKGAKIDVKGVDANNHANVVQAIKGYDVAASALGPFHRFEKKLVTAAIDAGVDYCSVCDEWDAAEAVFNDCSQAAKDAGRIILTGLGASPGVTSIAFGYLAARMDEVERCNVYVYQPLDAGGGMAVYKHMLHIISGEIAVWRDGKKTMIPALSEETSCVFPEYGRITVWNMGHAEPMTIPKFYPNIKEVNFYMGFGTGSNAFIKPARLGLFKTPSRVDRFAKLMAFAEKFTHKDEPAWGSIRVDVFGKKDGEAVHKIGCGTGQMRNITGLSLSVGALMLAKKELKTTEPGIYSPEGLVKPESFIREFSGKDLFMYEDVAMAHPVKP